MASPEPTLARLRHRLLERLPAGYMALPGLWTRQDEPARLLIGLLPDRVVFSSRYLQLRDADRQLYLLAHLAGHCLLGHTPWATAPTGPRRVAEDMQVNALLASLGWPVPPECAPPATAQRNLPVSALGRLLSPEVVAGYPLLDTHGLAHAHPDGQRSEEVTPGGQEAETDEGEAGEETEHPELSDTGSPPDEDDKPGTGGLRAGRLTARPATMPTGTTLPWWSWLARWLRFRSPRDYRFDRPGRREAPPFLLPSLGGREAWLMIAIDISGSIPDQVVQRFIDEVENLRRHVPARIRLLLADNRVHEDRLLPMGSPMVLPPIRGGGGTDFRPVLERFDRDQRQDLLIYFTDLRGEMPKRAPAGTVLWVRAGSDLKPPFGKVIDWT